MNVKEIATILKEHNDDLEYLPRDWGVFARISKMFDQEIIEDAVDSFPKEGNKPNVGAYLMMMCKKTAGKITSSKHTPAILNEI